MNSIDLYNIEKNHFSNTHSNFSKFLKNIKNIKEKDLSKDNLKKIIILNKKMLEINSLLEDINYGVNRRKGKLPLKIENELKDYENNDKAIQQFMPYILYYRFMLDS